MIRIGVDARCLNCDHLRGMGRYVFELLSQMTAIEDPQYRLYADRPDLPFHLPTSMVRASAEEFEMRGWRIQSWEQYGLPRRARRAKVDVLFCPSTTLPWWQPVPTVVTLHDTIPWTGSEITEQKWYWKQLLPRAYHKCAAIIAPSESARQDIASLWPKLLPKIEVIPHGIGDSWLNCEPQALDETLVKAGVRQPYLLYLGGDIPRKRLSWALQVFGRLQESDLQMVICGVGTAAQESVISRIPSELRGQVCFPGFVPESSMPNLVQHSISLLYPTLYEGFGFPVVEAQAVGTPVLYSNVGSLAELKGPGSVVLPVEDLDAWVRACEKLIGERRESPTPMAEGRTWARRFSWDHSASKHLEVFRRVASQNRRPLLSKAPSRASFSTNENSTTPSR